MIITLWHGSPHIIETPVYNKGNPDNDYGLGFYCTESEALAKEWACDLNRSGYANCYHLDLSSLTQLNLQSPPFTTLHWLAVLAANRKFQPDTAVAAQGLAYLLKHFHVNLMDYDLVRGYRADDSYFSFARAFVGNAISLSQLSYAMQLGKLGEQVVLRSKRSFQALQFIEARPAEASEYYVKRKQRDDAARAAYRLKAMQMDLNGIFMRDIIRERMLPNDPRLQSAFCE